MMASVENISLLKMSEYTLHYHFIYLFYYLFICIVCITVLFCLALSHLLSTHLILVIFFKTSIFGPKEEEKKKDWKREAILNMLTPLALHVRTIYHIHCFSKIAGVDRMQILLQ